MFKKLFFDCLFKGNISNLIKKDFVYLYKNFNKWKVLKKKHLVLRFLFRNRFTRKLYVEKINFIGDLLNEHDVHYLGDFYLDYYMVGRYNHRKKHHFVVNISKLDKHLINKNNYLFFFKNGFNFNSNRYYNSLDLGSLDSRPKTKNFNFYNKIFSNLKLNYVLIPKRFR